MLDALAAGGDSALNNAVWIMSARAAVYLASLRGSGGNPAFPLLTAKGGSLLGLPVYTASGLNSFDSPSESHDSAARCRVRFSIGDSGEAAISIAKDADVQLSDAPSSPATSTVSLFAVESDGAPGRALVRLGAAIDVVVSSCSTTCSLGNRAATMAERLSPRTRMTRWRPR